MKVLIALLLLVPALTFAQGREYISETERTTTINNGLVSSQVSTYRKEGTREWYDDCEMREWNTPWGKGTKVRCNWGEQQAMETALSSAPDGLVVEWYDANKRSEGRIVVYQSLPLSDSGWCRNIVRIKNYQASQTREAPVAMCYSEGQGWKPFLGR